MSQYSLESIFCLIDEIDLCEEEHCHDLQSAVNFIQAILKGSDRNYKIAKVWTGTKFRTLTIPRPYLMKIQRAILENIFCHPMLTDITGTGLLFGYNDEERFIKEQEFDYSVVHYGIEKRSIVTMALINSTFNPKCLFEIDLKNAFDYASKNMIRKALNEFLLQNDYWQKKVKVSDFTELILALTTYNGYLPQGAPTSSFLFNMACYFLDQKIIDFVNQANCKGDKVRARVLYTRYGDNFVFTSSRETMPLKLRKRIVRFVMSHGFKINRHKVKYISGKYKDIKIFNLNISQPPATRKKKFHPGTNGIKMSRARIEKYRVILHHQSKLGYPDINKIKGIISWVNYVYNGEVPNRLKIPFKRFFKAQTLA